MKNLSKRDYSILIGNAVDHFDTALYGFLAPVFAPLFFPASDPIISLMLAYSVFTTSIITRPLGSYIFGMIALTYSPAVSLSWSLIGVGLTTFAFGLLPAYEQLGYYAPALLIILRFFGGIFSAGEITIARLYILSDKNRHEAHKNSWLYQTSVMIGIVPASFVSAIALENPESQNWRVWFIAGGITAMFGYILRVYKTEKLSLDITQTLGFYSMRGAGILWKNKILLLRIAAVSGFSYMTYSIPFIVMNNLLPEFTDLTLKELMPSNTALLVIDMLLLPVIGLLLVNLRPKNVILISATILSVTIIPLWQLIEGGSFYYVIFIKLWIIIIGIAVSCPLNVWFFNLIPGPEKYLLVGIGSALGSAIIGKMAPATCLALYHYTRAPLAPGLFIVAVSACAAWAVATPPRRP